MAEDERGAGPHENVGVVRIEDEMRRSYLDYAMSVIVSRAIPDARDGLKPVHRRILWSMHQNGYTHDKPYRKCARVVGDVIGRYHPHGDQAVYEALVRMAQPFAMRLPLIDGQGNFGSVDGDPPAAMRYTECRLDRPAQSILADLEKDTVDFQDNYDGAESEPTVMPARYPNLLVNGAGGIAVGMATNIPPHNLGEICDAAAALIDAPDMTDEALLEIVPAPDFPTGGLILGRGGARQALLTGRGSVLVRGRTHVETIRKERDAIIVTEIPYQVNKAAMIERIADLVRHKKVEGVSDIRDESDRRGMRVVIELKRDAQADVVLNQLYRFSQLQTSFGVNMLALDGGRPQLLSLRQMLMSFLAFRENVVERRARHELEKARDRAHVLVGLAIAVANIDEVIRLIRTSPTPAVAREALMARSWPAKDMAPLVALIADPRHALAEDGSIRLTREQAQAILDLRLQRLTALGRDEIGEELKGLGASIEDLLDILGSRARVLGIVRDELAEVRALYADARRTEIVDDHADVEDEDLIPQEDMVVTVTRAGYAKRTPLSVYRAQRRGGRGRSGMATKDQDVVTRMFVASTHTPVLFFSTSGQVYKMKVWRLPLGNPQAKGKALVNLLPLAEKETISSIMALSEDEERWAELDVMFATRSGRVRRNKLSDFVNVNRAGKIAMKLEDGDGIVDVRLCQAADDVLLSTQSGRCIRFPVDDVRVFSGRTSTGVRGVELASDDTVIGMSVLRGVEATSAEARAYLRHAAAMRKAAGDADLDEPAVEEEEDEATLSPERIGELGAQEQFVLAVSERGFGKRTSSFEFRRTGRGGKGIVAMNTTDRTGSLVASFPVEETDEIMLVTNAGQVIRTGVRDVRIAARNTQGVLLFRTAETEQVVAVDWIGDASSEEEE